jgi:hypothetical protein
MKTRLRAFLTNVVYTLAAVYSWVAGPINMLHTKIRKR